MPSARVSLLTLLGVILLGLTACAGAAPEPTRSPTSASDRAAEALTEFFAALDQGRFADADTLYGGPYDVLQEINPDIDPEDHARLFERYCTQNGGVCLPVGSIVAQGVAEDGAELFIVQFTSDDGTVFGRGPCCGEPDTGARTTEFAFTVQEIDGTRRVMELPPYVP